jgi:glycosyltransferase involved in cell wall biosynthesis
MTKVLIVSPSFPYPEYKDGLAKINYNLLIRSFNYKADLLCIEDTKIVPIKDIKIFSIPLLNPMSKFKLLTKWLLSFKPFNVIKYEQYLSLLAQELSNIHQNYDVLHISSPFLAPLIDFVSKDVQKKMILFPIDSFTLFTKRRIQQEQNFIKELAYKFDFYKWKNFEIDYYQKYKKVVFVSDVDSEYVKKLNQNINTYFIPNGVDTEFFKKSDERKIEYNSLIFTGDMSYGPNEDAALILIEKIYPLLKKELEIKLYIVGQRPTEKIIKYQSKDIIITGFVDDIRTYIDKASLYISPLRYGSGIKNKVLEAMSMSKIVIGTDISFDAINVEDKKNTIKISHDPKEIASTIVKILKNVNNYKNIETNAREIIEEQYSWDGISLQYGELYENFIY